MKSELPFTNYLYHNKTSSLVSQLNSHLGKSNDDFIKFCESLLKQGLYLFLKVRISFPAGSCQENLKYFPPVIRKSSVPIQWLSESQRTLADSLGLNLGPSKVNLCDFAPQTQILSFQYVLLLINLNVRIDEILVCLSADKGPIFKTEIEKIISLKTHAKGTFFKGWAKLISNSSFGYLCLKVICA